ncbi:nitroreductase family deazaflavin-dependent oxidoreductase [Streptomyces sp. RM72]|uniref:nitroreductase family deazaflavin-dependent oxidoreductase n=1 Tax=unclassified Streptomyces TaxID=2593676 RepID=UPI000EF5E7FA|nr:MULTISPECIES: nitroreductase family deazaflavin-dependent oxidoreductase [unclassified Streptomyces]MBQ0886004.1 nitroreductase family deazaflavin-dependent oxidoreductase [Streptomyces sp. RM72]
MQNEDTDTGRPPLPEGWRRKVARAPVLLFRVGLGPLLGRRFLLLHHTGRVSGLDRRVVLEVVAFEPDTRAWTVASGFGPRADWYRNLREEPKTVLQFGNRHHAVTARFLAPEEGAAIMAEYGARHPRTARRLCAFMRLPSDGSAAALHRAGRAIPFVRLESQSPLDRLG